MSLPMSLGISLAMTLVLECAFGFLWGAGKEDFPHVLLANAATNPPVVATAWTIAHAAVPAGAYWTAVAAMEAAAFAFEGHWYARRTDIRLPWLFSLCANAFSFLSGLLISG